MQIPDTLKNKWVQLGSAAIASFVAGGGLGYILGNQQKKHERFLSEQRIAKEDRARQLELFPTLQGTRLEEVFVEQVNQLRRESHEEHIVQETLPVNKRVCANCGATNGEANQTRDNNYYCFECARIVDNSEREATRVNVFTIEDGDWDYEVELSQRESEAPYILHQDEFFNDEMGFQQETMTYYAGDDIMSDTDDSPIYNYQGLMGELRFGHGSKDPNVVYVRNEVIHMEWEILRHTGYFSEEVLGLEMEKAVEDEIKHSHSVQKFRQE